MGQLSYLTLTLTNLKGTQLNTTILLYYFIITNEGDNVPFSGGGDSAVAVVQDEVLGAWCSRLGGPNWRPTEYREEHKYTLAAIFVECYENVWVWVCYSGSKCTPHILYWLFCWRPMTPAGLLTAESCNLLFVRLLSAFTWEHLNTVICLILWNTQRTLLLLSNVFGEVLECDVGDPQFTLRHYKTTLWVDMQG